MLLTPQYLFRDVTHITPAFLRSQGIRALVLDVDNTLTLHDDPQVPARVRAWLEEMRGEGILLTIASNNGQQRVEPFARALGLEYVAKAHKPLSQGLEKARSRWGISRREMAIVGDQLFTDRLAGSLYGIPALVTRPLGPETKWYIRLKRVLEKPFFGLYFAKGGKIL